MYGVWFDVEISVWTSNFLELNFLALFTEPYHEGHQSQSWLLTLQDLINMSRSWFLSQIPLLKGFWACWRIACSMSRWIFEIQFTVDGEMSREQEPVRRDSQYSTFWQIEHEKNNNIVILMDYSTEVYSDRVKEKGEKCQLINTDWMTELENHFVQLLA